MSDAILIKQLRKIMTNIDLDRVIEVLKSIIGNEITLNEYDKQSLINIVRSIVNIALRLRNIDLEVENLLNALKGKYIEPGPGGSILRGKIEVLPTGRNMYGIDPMRIPTPAAWEVGVRLAKKLLERYVKDYGKYPETIAIIEWCVDPFKADGEGIAQILYLLGVKPVWDPESGCILDIEPIPLKELGRPRIDVLVRVDGIFRDTTPNLMELIDKAIVKVAQLDEPPEMNYVRKHVLERMKQLIKEGCSETNAFRIASLRVFSEKPGVYGSGVNYVVYSSSWKSKEDIAEVWIEWSSYAYGQGVQALHVPDQLKYVLSHVGLTFEKLESDEFDLLDCCCFYSYHGGMHVAAEVLSGKKLPSYFGDTKDPDRVQIRLLSEEIERIVYARLLNPEYLEKMKNHGFRGAGELAERVGRVYGWAATAGVVSDFIFNKIAEKFVLDESMRKWFMENNPWALEEITRRLLEANMRGIWNAPKELIEKLREVISQIESYFEESITSSSEYMQGSSIVIITKRELKEKHD